MLTAGLVGKPRGGPVAARGALAHDAVGPAIMPCLALPLAGPREPGADLNALGGPAVDRRRVVADRNGRRCAAPRGAEDARVAALELRGARRVRRAVVALAALARLAQPPGGRHMYSTVFLTTTS